MKSRNKAVEMQPDNQFFNSNREKSPNRDRSQSAEKRLLSQATPQPSTGETENDEEQKQSARAKDTS